MARVADGPSAHGGEKARDINAHRSRPLGVPQDDPRNGADQPKTSNALMRNVRKSDRSTFTKLGYPRQAARLSLDWQLLLRRLQEKMPFAMPSRAPGGKTLAACTTAVSLTNLACVSFKVCLDFI